MDKLTELTFERLLDWLEGQLTEEDAAAVEREVAAAGPEVHDVLAWLRRFQQVSEGVVLGTPPPSIREELKRRFRTRRAKRERVSARFERQRGPGILRRLTAALTFDSGSELVLSGVRSPGGLASAENARQLLYETDLAEIAINLQPQIGGSGFELMGQVYPLEGSEPPHFSAQLLYGGEEIGLTTTDELGEFFFPDLRSGQWSGSTLVGHTILLCNDQVEIELPLPEATG
ncbi:MAG: hypothetical protein R3272_16190 [Candidatus Promineifilaceae bacterium]|nr:hypothetical protein [Candidatus Promineifilaceae bacterium]